MIIISLPRQAPYVCKLFPLELIATLAYWGASIAWSAMLPMFPCPCFMLSHSFTPLPTPLLPCAVWNWLDFMHKLHSHRSLGCGKSFVCLPPMPGFYRFSDFLHCQLALRMRHGGHRPLAIVKQRPHVKYANVICICSSTERVGGGAGGGWGANAAGKG